MEVKPDPESGEDILNSAKNAMRKWNMAAQDRDDMISEYCLGRLLCKNKYTHRAGINKARRFQKNNIKNNCEIGGQHTTETPDHDVIREEMFDMAIGGVGCLDTRERKAFLWYSQGLNSREIGEIMRMSRTRIEDFIRAAKEKLLIYMTEQGYDHLPD